jgi:hypothetical protein
MVRIVPLGVFKNGFDLVDGDGRRLGGFRGSVWRENGEIVAGERRYAFQRAGRRHFELVEKGQAEAVADRPSFWGGSWTIEAGERRYELARGGWLTRRYDLLRDGEKVGQVAPRGWGSRGGDADLPAELPVAAQAFVVAIVLTLWRREEASASSGAASSAG